MHLNVERGPGGRFVATPPPGADRAPDPATLVIPRPPQYVRERQPQPHPRGWPWPVRLAAWACGVALPVRLAGDDAHPWRDARG